MVRILALVTLGLSLIAVSACSAPKQGAREALMDKGKSGGKKVSYGSVVTVNDSNWEAEVVAASNDSAVLVDMWATWCGPCRTQGPIIESLAREMPDVKFVKLDVDANKVENGFGINAIPTLIIYRNGREVWRAVGVNQKSELTAALASHT